MPNQLLNENSPYLRQHANQSVDWMTWSLEALQKADRENKPILISIGYASCHWCQTMSRENFSDSYVASLMNRHFVCILIDRDERPDLDQTYMEANRMFNQSAGWPLHAFCLPDGKPFWGGTFFPKENTEDSIAPWPQVLMRISEHYRKSPSDLIENANNVMGNLAHANHPNRSNEEAWNSLLLVKAVQKICNQHDSEYGGFTQAPKFPSPMKIDFLLAISESQFARSNPTIQKQISDCVQTSLVNMASGGVFDQLGGGFFRYSMDRKWQVPHFEKMLSDNALLISTYARAFRKYKETLYQEVVIKSLNWMFREMGNENEGFGCSLDSESEGVEGAYYLWNKRELDLILGPESSAALCDALGTIDHFPDQPVLPRRLAKGEFDQIDYSALIEKLIEARAKRIPPKLDKKRSVSLNALVLRSLVDAALALNDLSWLQKAFSLASWMENTFANEEFGIQPIYYPGEDSGQNYETFLDDFAFWTESLLYLASVSELLEQGSSKRFLALAENLATQTKKFFKDEKAPGYFFSSSSMQNPPPIRKKFWYDNATPSGNSSLLRVFSLLSSFTQSREWELEYIEARTAFPKLALNSPENIACALTAITEETVGIPVLEISLNEKSKVLEKISEYPHRPFFIKENKSKTDQIKIKGKSVNIENNAQLWKVLFN